MEPRDDPFQPKRVDEQVEWLAKSMQEGAQARNQSARLVQRLQNYYVRKRQKDLLKHAWGHIAQRYEDLVLASSGEEHVQNEERNPTKLGQYRVHQERISAMQKNTIQPFSQHPTGWKRRLSVFAAILCMMVLIGGFLTISNVMHANRTTSVGSHVVKTPPTPSPSGPVTHSIPKALLTASGTGNSEGIGPELGGITATNQFTVGKRFWIFFLLTDDSGGTVAVRWYANGHLYSSSSHYEASLPGASSQPSPKPTPSLNSPVPTPSRNSPAPAGTPIEDSFSVIYNQPAQGKVELYWKGKLAVTLFFVVKS